MTLKDVLTPDLKEKPDGTERTDKVPEIKSYKSSRNIYDWMKEEYEEYKPRVMEVRG